MSERVGRVVRGLVVMAAMLAMPAGGARALEGPWNASVLQGGTGLEKPLPAQSPVLQAGADWSMWAWVRPDRLPAGRMLLAGIGDPQGQGRYFASHDGALALNWDMDHALASSARLQPGHWQLLAAVAQAGTVVLSVDGKAVARGRVPVGALAPRLVLGPERQPWPQAPHFGGRIAGFSVQAGAVGAGTLADLARQPPDEGLTRYESASPSWPVQTKQMAGQVAPQPPSTLPVSRAPFARPVAVPVGQREGLHAQAGQADAWSLGDWFLASAPELGTVDGAALSMPGGQTGGRAWLAATVPGTVLGTLVDRGVYPDPDFGLDNMAIPESLNQHDWWYRSEFEVPAGLSGRRLRLDFNGINYAAEIWLNGQRLGTMRGAFARGVFDVTGTLLPGRRNALAVRVSPPPHPGIPHEQSLSGGVGENGGMQALDGPTFIASEGWDWIPAVRDRNTGMWQDVVLHATGPVAIGDAWVSTTLAADHDSADLRVQVPLDNASGVRVRGEVMVTIDGATLRKAVSVAPGASSVSLGVDEFPQLRLRHPRLWWPNGYGEPALYDMQVVFTAGDAPSDRKHVRFGVREVSYELSLFDAAGELRRVEYDPSRAPGQRVVDVRHQAIRKTPNGWAQSFLSGAENSPAVRALDDTQLAPYLAIRVNGVRIAVKGGNWGMDDWRKRISRARLEPYFRLQRDAHMNVIRNWVGQSTEPVLYELADEYGLMVINDFWQSTQNYNLEPDDDALFLSNAADTISRYRGHPSIVLWFGRNEGVPPPHLNEGLDALVAGLDGTRLYMGSSNEVNLHGSGPYNYREPQEYFTSLAQGFSVEVGTPSLATLEALQAMMAPQDLWPISDAWAYHDWHQTGNGAVATFMDALALKFGPATSLEDFERKAQLMNYETYRAVFEGLNAGLWTRNSGRMLWMTHPAWPSLMWQIYSHDYDTHAAYYGTKEASAPLHVQMDLPQRVVRVVNNTATGRTGLRVQVQAWASDGRLLGQDEVAAPAPAVASTPVATALDLDGLVARHALVIVGLRLLDADGGVLDQNMYWSAATAGDLRGLDGLAKVELQVQAEQVSDTRLRVQVRNPSASPVLSAKLTLQDAHGARILPAFYSDNYLNLAPGDIRTVLVDVPQGGRLQGAHLGLRGWNVVPASIVPDQQAVAAALPLKE